MTISRQGHREPARSVVRTRIYTVVQDATLRAGVARCRDAQRATYNRTLAACGVAAGAAVPALQKTPTTPDGLYGQLTTWRKTHEWMAKWPLTLQRPAVRGAHTAVLAFEKAREDHAARVTGEQVEWAAWRAEHPEWDSGAWDRMEAAERRQAVARKEAPPKPRCGTREEKKESGDRRRLLRRKRHDRHTAVVWDTPPTSSRGSTLTLSGLGPVEVKGELPTHDRILSVRLVERRGRKGRVTMQVHLSVRIDVEEGSRGRRRRMARWAPHKKEVVGVDMGVRDTCRPSRGPVLRLEDDESPGRAALLERAGGAQRDRQAARPGSSRARRAGERYRRCRRKLTARDVDQTRKWAKRVGTPAACLALEDLKAAPMGRRPTGNVGVRAKATLNRKIRRAAWRRITECLASTVEQHGGVGVALPGAWSSSTCSACGHVDPKSRHGKRFRCTRCGAGRDADGNAADVMEERMWTWLRARRGGATADRAREAVWQHIQTQRRASRKRTKPCSPDENQGRGSAPDGGQRERPPGAHAPSTGNAERTTPPDGRVPEDGCARCRVQSSSVKTLVPELHPMKLHGGSVSLWPRRTRRLVRGLSLILATLALGLVVIVVSLVAAHAPGPSGRKHSVTP